jgi:hypothetical protein
LSKLFDRLKNAARTRAENASGRGGLLSQALQRAEAQRAQARAANDQNEADLESSDAHERAEREAEAMARAEAERAALEEAQRRADEEKRAADDAAEARVRSEEHARMAALAHADADAERVVREEADRRAGAEEAEAAERGLRNSQLRRRIARRATGALIAFGALVVAALAWNYLPTRSVPVPVFQLDRNLRM